MIQMPSHKPPAVRGTTKWPTAAHLQCAVGRIPPTGSVQPTKADLVYTYNSKVQWSAPISLAAATAACTYRLNARNTVRESLF